MIVTRKAKTIEDFERDAHHMMHSSFSNEYTNAMAAQTICKINSMWRVLIARSNVALLNKGGIQVRNRGIFKKTDQGEVQIYNLDEDKYPIDLSGYQMEDEISMIADGLITTIPEMPDPSLYTHDPSKISPIDRIWKVLNFHKISQMGILFKLDANKHPGAIKKLSLMPDFYDDQILNPFEIHSTNLCGKNAIWLIKVPVNFMNTLDKHESKEGLLHQLISDVLITKNRSILNELNVFGNPYALFHSYSASMPNKFQDNGKTEFMKCAGVVTQSFTPEKTATISSRLVVGQRPQEDSFFFALNPRTEEGEVKSTMLFYPARYKMPHSFIPSTFINQIGGYQVACPNIAPSTVTKHIFDKIFGIQGKTLNS